MSGKSSTGQRQRRVARQRPGQGDGRPGAQRPATAAGQRKAALAAERKAKLAAARQAQRRAERRRKIGMRAAIAVGAAAIIAGLFIVFHNASSSGAGAYPYQVGSPGPGQRAPGFTLAASTGGRISLSQYRVRSVLLFFQEGLTCQPCWNQISDMQKHVAQLKAAGVGQVISITSDPVGAITQKARDMGLTIPVLSDPGLAVSQQYRANAYGMMGSSRDGHTFIPGRPERDDPLARRLRRPAEVHHVFADHHAAGRHQGRGAPVMTAVTLLTQDHCALCEHAKGVLARVGADLPLEVTEIDLASQQGRALAAEAGVLFAPGLLVEGCLLGYGRLSERKLRRALQRLPT